MDQSEQEYIEDEFYIALSISCTKCYLNYSPLNDSDWESTGNDELDASKMKEVYAPKMIGLGWSTNKNGDILCPKCS